MSFNLLKWIIFNGGKNVILVINLKKVEKETTNFWKKMSTDFNAESKISKRED